MKNVKNLFGMAVMATALVGCSSNDNLNPNANDNAGKAGTAYASFNIELPSTRGTRAAVDFEDGDAEEYAVKKAQLVVFKKGSATSEGGYTWVENVDLGNLEPWNNGSDDITRYANITAELKTAKVNDTDEYYALIVLNNDGKVTLPTTEGTTYSSWNVASNATSTFLNNDNGFYMANAPEFVSGGEPTTLVPIKGIYRTKQEAQIKPATTVYVERGMAKVTITDGSFGDKLVTTSTTTYAGDHYDISSWALDVLNKSTFPVHMTTGLKSGSTTVPAAIAAATQIVTAYANIWENNSLNHTDRFVGGNTFKRVYWGIDPNYSLGLTDLDKCKASFFIANKDGKKYSDGTTNVAWTASGTSQYCLENTFDINNMKQGQTTRVIFKATYTPKALLGESDKTFFMIGNNPNIWTKTTLIQQITNKAKELNANVASVDFKSDAALLKAGSHNLTADDITIKDASDNAITTINFVDLNSKLGLVNGLLINTYAGGECYYIARIKHFNELTPWGAGQPTYGVINDTNNDSYLGRYGVLRNNWYELTVNSVSGPGYPDVPEVKPTEPDDENTKFINVEVKILDWAKRSQSIDL